jgi:hypothetical protein
MMLGRNNLLNAYYTDKNLFSQALGVSLRTIGPEFRDKPICSPPGESEMIAAASKTYDPVLIQHIQQSPIQELISISTRRMQGATTIREAERMREDHLVDLCNMNKSQFCVELSQTQNIQNDCQLIGGTKSPRAPDAATLKFLDSMAHAKLSGVIIWGLTPEADHTHVYIHKAIHKAVKVAFEFSPIPMHLCYVQENPAFDLGRDFFNGTKRGRLVDSLVFSSPKHMTWSNDPGFLMLPLDSTARYVFHGETPRPHRVLKSTGIAIEHEAWGPGE